MKILSYILFFCLMSTRVLAQEKTFTVHEIILPAQLKDPENQFSGLQVANGQLYLLPECRIQDKHDARIYSISLTELDKAIKDTSYRYPVITISIRGLDELAARMKQQGQEFEGLESMWIDRKHIYLSVETTTASAYCYLLKGKLKNDKIYLNTFMTRVPKPTRPDGSTIYNAGFEAMTMIHKSLWLFYEYNYFKKNYSYSYRRSISNHTRDSIFILPLPYRITDISPSTPGHFTGINFFFKGEGPDTVYRVSPADPIAYHDIHPQNNFTDYCRLIDVYYSERQFRWQTLWVLPKEYTGYNWEGIAYYNGGYFITNDKYTLTRPYRSVLLYIK